MSVWVCEWMRMRGHCKSVFFSIVLELEWRQRFQISIVPKRFWTAPNSIHVTKLKMFPLKLWTSKLWMWYNPNSLGGGVELNFPNATTTNWPHGGSTYFSRCTTSALADQWRSGTSATGGKCSVLLQANDAIWRGGNTLTVYAARV